MQLQLQFDLRKLKLWLQLWFEEFWDPTWTCLFSSYFKWSCCIFSASWVGVFGVDDSWRDTCLDGLLFALWILCAFSSLDGFDRVISSLVVFPEMAGCLVNDRPRFFWMDFCCGCRFDLCLVELICCVDALCWTSAALMWFTLFAILTGDCFLL